MTRHALERMEERAISRQEIDRALRFGKRTDAPRNGYFYTYDRVRVVVAKANGAVLTTYRLKAA